MHKLLQTDEFGECNPDVEETARDDDERENALGRRLAEFDKFNEWAASLWLLVTGTLYAAVIWNVALDMTWKLAGGLIPLFATCALCELLPGGKDRLRHHERGLSLIHVRERRELSFDDLDSFIARWVECRSRGVYVGTNVDLTFYSRRTAEPIRFLATIRRGKPDEARLMAMLDRAVDVVAARMWEELQHTGRVKWTSRLTLLNDGLEHRERADFEPVMIPFSSICGWNMEEGHLRIRFGERPRLATESTAAENFFAGMRLFEELSRGWNGLNPENRDNRLHEHDCPLYVSDDSAGTAGRES